MEPTTQPKRRIRVGLIRNLAFLVALLLLAGNVGYRMGQRNTTFAISETRKLIVNSSPPPNRDVDFTLFWDVWSRLEQKYVDKTKIDPQKMVDGAIAGMVSALGDPYTVYLPPKENEDFKQDLNGTFEGIGAQLGSKDERVVVIAPLKDHPAEKAGIRAGDWIVKVNGEETFGWTVPQTVTKIRGPKGTQVELVIIHEGEQEQKTIKVTRDTIIVKSVELETVTSKADQCKTQTCPKVAHIKLARFGDQTNDEWNTAIAQARDALMRGEVRGIVLDVRNNPGGYLQSAIYIASEFIKNGIIVAQENSDGSKETYSVTRVGNLLEAPVVVLINKGSASASEILSGALRDHNRATLVGETSFGKGSIQTPEDLPNGGGIHITTARWLLPKGDQINSKGIKPDIEVKSATDAAALDLQLERAIEELVK